MQTAEGALEEVNRALINIRQLTVASANEATNDDFMLLSRGLGDVYKRQDQFTSQPDTKHEDPGEEPGAIIFGIKDQPRS